MSTATRVGFDSPANLKVMQAIVYDDYGDSDVLHLTERPIPRRKSGQVLIQVWASSVNPIDYRLRKGEMKWLLPGGFPRVPGYDVAGVVVEGSEDGAFVPGDRVMAFLNSMRGGALAEFSVCSSDVVAKIPPNMTMQEAAAIPLAGTTALQSLRDHGKLNRGQRVLVNGASGGVGAFAVQIAKSYHCRTDAVASGRNEAFCKSLGADRFFDYQKVHFAESNERWDVLFDAAGKSNFWEARKVLSAGGRFVSTEPNLQGVFTSLCTWPFSKSARVMLAKANAGDLKELIRLYEADQLKVTIDREYPLNEASAAHHRVEQGVDRGKVVLLMPAFENSRCS